MTGNNSGISNAKFARKRDMENGLGDSALRLNEGMKQVETWNEDAIKTRAQKLAKRAFDVWAMPEAVSEEDIQSFRKTSKFNVNAWSTISVDDIPSLQDPKTRALFNELNTAFLAIDELADVEPYRSYIAYKVETNYVDISPRKGWLQLYFNINYNDLIDERKLCEDVSDRGRTAVGATRMALRSADDIPYAVGLARQALEKQLGD